MVDLDRRAARDAARDIAQDKEWAKQDAVGKIADAPSGDWNLRGLDAAQRFALNPLPDDCIDAAAMTHRDFYAGFPGWKLYTRIVRGDTVFDRDLKAWAVSLARTYVRAKKLNGHSVVAKRGRRNDWIAQAGEDALAFAIFGRFPVTAESRSTELGITNEVYKRVRDVLAGGMFQGAENYAMTLHSSLSRVRSKNRFCN